MLTAFTLVGGGAGDGRDKARARSEPGLLLCSVATPTFWGQSWVPRCWSKSPECWVRSGFFTSPSQHWHSHPVLEQEGLERVLGVGLGVGCDGPSPSQGPGLPLMHCLCKVPVVASTAFLTCHSRSELVPSLTTEFSLQLPSTAAHPSVELWHKASGARVWALSSVWGMCWSSQGKLTRVPGSFNLLSPPCFES